MKVFQLILLLISATVVLSQTNGRAVDFRQLEETVTNELKEKNAAGAAVAIVSGDKILFAKGFGTANIETKQPVTPETLFQIGSVTKTFTALAVLGFAEEGKLKLDAPVGNYAAGLSPKLSQVTLSQLLSHTAGIIDEPDEYGLQDESLMAVYIRSWKDDYRLFEPGEVFSYSNSGFALAGFTMQEAVGKPYVDLINERIFSPLAMTRTTFRPTVAMTYPLAVGHRRGKLEVVRPLPNDARLYPAGTFYTSANDLARFAVAFLNEGKIEGKEIISPAAIKKMQIVRAKQESADDVNYGYGLYLNKMRGLRVVSHGGSMTGYTASLMFVPEHRFALIILSNTDGINLNKTQDKAMEMFLPLAPPETPQPKAKMPLSETEMQKYVGIYSQPNRWKAEVFARGGKLFLKQFGSELEMSKIGDNRFSIQFPNAPAPIEISFKTGADGKAVWLNQFVWAFKKI